MQNSPSFPQVTVRGVIVDGVARLHAEVPRVIALRWQAAAALQGLPLKDALVEHLFAKDRTSPAAVIEETARAMAAGAAVALCSKT